MNNCIDNESCQTLIDADVVEAAVGELRNVRYLITLFLERLYSETEHITRDDPRMWSSAIGFKNRLPMLESLLHTAESQIEHISDKLDTEVNNSYHSEEKEAV